MSENTTPAHNSTSSTAPQHMPSEPPHEAHLNIVVGLAGGIAAYKAAHLPGNFVVGFAGGIAADLAASWVCTSKEHGADVRVVNSDAPLSFVGAATFDVLSGNPVSTAVFFAVDEVPPVNVWKHADALVTAP